MAIVWKAPNNIVDLLHSVIEANHLPRLEGARFAVALTDTKPFIKNRFNWGKVMKFNDFNRLWQAQPSDFSIIMCSDVWHDFLTDKQREAILDLQVSRCEPEYEPEVIIEGKKKKIVKDELGRIKYTNQIKTDDEGRPKWLVNPLDFETFARNTIRYGVWMKGFVQGELIGQAQGE